MMEQYLTNKELQKLFTALSVAFENPIFRNDKKIMNKIITKLRQLSYFSNDDDQILIKLIHPENA